MSKSDSKNTNNPSKSRYVLFIVMVGLVLLLWILSIVLIPIWFSKPEDQANFGSMFGAVNALFAGLAFAGVIWTILLQKDELELQRDVLEEQKETLQRQNFESTFFQLLGLHNDIVNSMEIKRGQDGEYHGRECFAHMLSKLQIQFESFSDQENIGIDQASIDAKYERFFVVYQPHVGHYFRNLYNIVKYVNRSGFFCDRKFDEKKLYTNLIRAQLSSDELGLLFYNCLSKRGARFKVLIEEFALLEDMRPQILFDQKHIDLFNHKAYGESIWLKQKKEN